MNECLCGCGTPVKRLWARGHNLGQAVPNEPVVKMLHYLKPIYGSWVAIAQATELPLSTIEKILYRRGRVLRTTALKIAAVVLLYKERGGKES